MSKEKPELSREQECLKRQQFFASKLNNKAIPIETVLQVMKDFRTVTSKDNRYIIVKETPFYEGTFLYERMYCDPCGFDLAFTYLQLLRASDPSATYKMVSQLVPWNRDRISNIEFRDLSVKQEPVNYRSKKS